MIEPGDNQSEKKRGRGRGRPAKVQKLDEGGSSGDRSELDMMRERNIIEKSIMFKTTGLLESAAAFEATLKRKQEKVRPGRDPSTLAGRSTRSNRIAAQQDQAILPAADASKVQDKKDKSLKDCVAPFSKPEDVPIFLEVAKEVQKESPKKSSELQSMEFSTMKEKLEGLCKISELMLNYQASKVTALAVHRSVNPLLLTSGTKSGSVCIWKVEEDDPEVASSQVFGFGTHVDQVNHLLFGADHPNFLFSSSRDGTVKCLDLNREQFTLCHKTLEEETWLTWHAQVKPSVLLVASSEGCLLRLDTREEAVSKFQCHYGSINSVDVVRENCVLTASDDGIMSIWDLRCMSTSKSVDSGIVKGRQRATPITEAVESAFFSPQGGNRLLASSKDHFYVYDHAPNLAPFQSFSGVILNSDTRKSNLPMAHWHPSRSDVFVAGGSSGPAAGINIFNAKVSSTPTVLRQADYLIKDGCTSSVLFHPTCFVLVSAAASKIHVFK
ncbi:WD repeat-containing protein 76-like isoform X2 [Neocloeon triangulifer]|uniref:WD repeat-containing protein 76-like isoform X2 n=1 Tax=Neocloeon triangulifer TaxID=2078957 RepID=UPI00286FAC7B|nr:WD repeat-containing protein 76-like isoform X2 [Neocloeon triangulifer]XP_059474706.1 WD repeat-containing protein 76-like isoform X2 [Neocloeon triangulifer]